MDSKKVSGINNILTELLIVEKAGKIRPPYFHWTVKVVVNTVNIIESDPLISTGIEKTLIK